MRNGVRAGGFGRMMAQGSLRKNVLYVGEIGPYQRVYHSVLKLPRERQLLIAWVSHSTASVSDTALANPRPPPSVLLPAQLCQSLITGEENRHLVSRNGTENFLFLTFFSLRKTTSSLGQICVCGQTIAPGITHLPHPPTALHHWDNWFTFLSSSLPLSYGQSNLSQEANMNCKFISAVLNCAAL